MNSLIQKSSHAPWSYVLQITVANPITGSLSSEFHPAPTTEELSQMEHDAKPGHSKELADSFLNNIRKINASSETGSPAESEPAVPQK